MLHRKMVEVGATIKTLITNLNFVLVDLQFIFFFAYVVIMTKTFKSSFAFEVNSRANVRILNGIFYKTNNFLVKLNCVR